MKTLYFTQREGCSYYNRPILVDIVNNKFSVLSNEGSYIDDMYVAKEPVEIKYEYKGKTYLKNADKGDIILTFRIPDNYDIVPVIVVKNNDWKTNIINRYAMIEANRAKDTVKASYELQSDNCGCCDSCKCECGC